MAVVVGGHGVDGGENIVHHCTRRRQPTTKAQKLAPINQSTQRMTGISPIYILMRAYCMDCMDSGIIMVGGSKCSLFTLQPAVEDLLAVGELGGGEALHVPV